MIKISPKQAQIRLRTLPEEIKNALFSEEGTALVHSIGEKNHLIEDKRYDLDLLVGYILSGFIYQGDLEKEIESYLHVPHQSAIDIGKEIREKILDEYKNKLEKLFQPLSETDFGLTVDRRKEDRGPAPAMIDSSSRPVKLKVESAPIPPSAAKNVPPSTPSIPKPAPSPVVMGNRPTESRPINTPKEFKVSSSMPSTRVSMPSPPSTRPARVELGKMKEEIKVASPTKDVGREPIRYSSPKNIFMPQPGTNPALGLPVPPKAIPRPVPPPPKAEIKPMPPAPPAPTK